METVGLVRGRRSVVMVPKTQTLEQALLWGKDAESSFRCVWISRRMSKSGTQSRRRVTEHTPDRKGRATRKGF